MDALETTAFNRAFAAMRVMESASRLPDTERRPVVADEGVRSVALGLSRSELRQYSLARALRDLAQGVRHSFERDVSAELRRNHNAANESGNYLLVPPDALAHAIQQRDLTVASASGGGHLVATEQAATSYVELVRNRAVTLSLGATAMPDQVANVTIPRQTGAATGYFLSSEGTQATESQQSFGQLVLTPKVCGAYTEFSRQMLAQANPSVDYVIARDFAPNVGDTDRPCGADRKRRKRSIARGHQHWWHRWRHRHDARTRWNLRVSNRCRFRAIRA